MTPRVRCLASIVLLLAGLCPARVHAGQLAVFRIDPLGVEAEIVARLDGLLRLELGRLVDAAMPTPRQVEQLLKRHPRLQNCTGELTCLSEAAKLLGVQRIISGNVGGLAGSYVLNLKLVDAESRQEVRRIQESISGRPDQLIESVRVAAYSLVAPERVRGAIAVLANIAGATVYLDGRPIGTTPLPIHHGLRTGRHALRVSKAGYVDVVQAVQIHFQKTAQVVVTLQLPSKERQRPKHTARPMPWYTRWWFWTIVSVAAVGAGVGLGFAASSSRGINCDAEPARCGL